MEKKPPGYMSAQVMFTAVRSALQGQSQHWLPGPSINGAKTPRPFKLSILFRTLDPVQMLSAIPSHQAQHGPFGFQLINRSPEASSVIPVSGLRAARRGLSWRPGRSPGAHFGIRNYAIFGFKVHGLGTATATMVLMVSTVSSIILPPTEAIVVRSL